MIKMISVNIIGAGHWGPNIIRGYSEMDGVCVHMVADKDEKRLQIIKNKHPSIEVTDSAEEAIHDPEAQAVIVATPVNTHYELVKSALEAGKHVFVEKPICNTVAEAEELCELAASKNLKLMVGHVFLFNNSIIKVKEIIDSGELGDILYIDAVRTNLGPVRGDVNAFWDLSTHDISIINYWLDKRPEKISMTGSKPLSGNCEDVCFATLAYNGGTLAHMHASWLNPCKVRQITVVGDKKMLVWDDINMGRTITVYDNHIQKPDISDSYGQHKVGYHLGDIVIPKVQANEPLKTELIHFIDAINGAPLQSGGEMGADIVKVLVASDTSLDSSGKFIEINY